MTAFICFFFPAVASVWLVEYLFRQELRRKHWLYLFCTNTMIINFLCFTFKHLVLDTGGAPLYQWSTDMVPSAACHYLIMAIPSAMILAFVEVCAAKNTKIAIKDAVDDESKKQ